MPAPESTPAFSPAAGGRLTARAADRSSCRVNVAPAGLYPPTAAPIVIDSGPYSRPLSMIVSGNVAEVCPAGMVMLAGADTRLGSLDVTLTIRSLVSAWGIVSVPSTSPAPTVTFAGTTGVTGGRLETANRLPSPVCPAPSSTWKCMAAPACWAVALPVHTPCVKVTVVGKTGPGV